MKTKIPMWKKQLMLITAKREIKKLYKKHRKDIEKVMEDLQTIVESEDDKYAINMVVVICSSLIGGFEDQESRKAAAEMISMTVMYME